MRGVIIGLIFILFVIKPVLSQNYQTTNSGRISYFLNEYNYVSCIRIDSAKYLSDSVLYPFTVIKEIDFGCYSPWVASWIGPKVVISENGMNYFFNRSNDTIRIQTRADINDKWIAYYFEDSSFVEATLIEHDTMNFLSLNDSVKTIGFQVFDKKMDPLEHDINQMTIEISKNYGLIKTLNFYLFPDNESIYSGEKLSEYHLAGLSTPKTGIQNISWYDVNDFQPGDELHILDESMIWYGVGMTSLTTDKAIYKYLDRIDTRDSIVYKYAIRKSVYTVWEDTSSFIFYNDTLTSIIKPDPDFDKLPGEPVFTDYSVFSYYITGNSKIDPGASEEYYSNNDTCWFMILADGCLPYYTYLRGLGGPYYSCLYQSWIDRKLVYYRKGDIVWGTPLVITNSKDRQEVKRFEVYPNPAKDYIIIQQKYDISGKLRFALFDLNGRIILNEPIDNADKHIDIMDVTPGVYIYRILNKYETVYMNKLIIE